MASTNAAYYPQLITKTGSSEVVTGFEHNKLQQINWVARITLALVFFFHGLVPKILFPSEVELMLVKQHGLPIDALLLSQIGGAIEMLLGLMILIISKRLWPVYLAVLLLFVLLLDTAIIMPELLVAAFNPVTTNISCMALAWTVIISQAPRLNNR